MAGSDQLVARVAVAVGLAHLDRPFEYSVPADQREAVGVGCRVSVRFSGRLVSGFVLGLARASTHPGPLQPLHRVVSPEPVLS
ncbi:MAG: primosome assembly protein PriA, partial [Actinomycetota bacterium]|nr:primosome assembly protein PriA [Actinomycetota bacterium]